MPALLVAAPNATGHADPTGQSGYEEVRYVDAARPPYLLYSSSRTFCELFAASLALARLAENLRSESYAYTARPPFQPSGRVLAPALVVTRACLRFSPRASAGGRPSSSIR